MGKIKRFDKKLGIVEDGKMAPDSVAAAADDHKPVLTRKQAPELEKGLMRGAYASARALGDTLEKKRIASRNQVKPA